MEKNKRITILIILIIVVIIVWMPKGRIKQQVSPPPTQISLEKKATPKITPGQRKRTEFVDWGRNPFVWRKATAGPTSGLTLSGIVWDEEASYAIINGDIVHTGDTIDGKTVKRIEQDKVILNDGLKDYTLRLP